MLFSQTDRFIDLFNNNTKERKGMKRKLYYSLSRREESYKH